MQYSADGLTDRARLRVAAHAAIVTTTAAATMPVTIHGVVEDVLDVAAGARAAATPAGNETPAPPDVPA